MGRASETKLKATMCLCCAEASSLQFGSVQPTTSSELAARQKKILRVRLLPGLKHDWRQEVRSAHSGTLWRSVKDTLGTLVHQSVCLFVCVPLQQLSTAQLPIERGKDGWIDGNEWGDRNNNRSLDECHSVATSNTNFSLSFFLMQPLIRYSAHSINGNPFIAFAFLFHRLNVLSLYPQAVCRTFQPNSQTDKQAGKHAHQYGKLFSSPPDVARQNQ